jgi:hypothetical protein
MNDLAILGSRTFTDYVSLKAEIDQFIQENPTIKRIISGGAAGADKLGEKYALEKNLKLLVLKPDWRSYGKRAGLLRNTDIVNASDALIFFHDGQSKGTLHAISEAKKKSKVYKIVKF